MTVTLEQLAEVLKRADELVVGTMNEDAAPGMSVGTHPLGYELPRTPFY